ARRRDQSGADRASAYVLYPGLFHSHAPSRRVRPTGCSAAWRGALPHLPTTGRGRARMSRRTDIGAQRVIDMIKTAFGPLGALAQDPTVVEIMANPDGVVWCERVGEPMQQSGMDLMPEARRTIIALVAGGGGVAALSAEGPRRGCDNRGIPRALRALGAPCRRGARLCRAKPRHSPLFV